ncbi:putative T-complex protein 1 subunit beta [Schizosaccharomyces pombe]
MSLNPHQIFNESGIQERGENARLSSFVGAIAVGDLVKSTLGPKGMDKILQSNSSGDIVVTNDGATILKSIALDNAAAKVLVNISKVQDDEVGDGTTSVCVFAAELLRQAEIMVNAKIHPQVIIDGYRIATKTAIDALRASSIDNSSDPAKFRSDLENIARTTLSSKILSQNKNHFAQLAVDAVLRLKGSTNLDNIQIIKILGGKLDDSFLDEGFILNKTIGVNCPKVMENANILIANTAMDTDKVKVFGARVRVDTTGKLAELERAEREKMKAKVEKIKSHNINCFINRQLIYNWPEQLFADAGIMSIEHADFDGIERLSLVTGGEIASTFDHPELVKLGHCKKIEEIIIGEDKMIKFSGVEAGEACTIVLRGATHQLLDESERAIHDALAVLSQTVAESRVTLGGGCAEMLMAKAVEEAATHEPGKKAVAVSAFAKALSQLPTILADNAGFDSSELVAQLKAAHYDGNDTMGLDMDKGEIADMRAKGILEALKLKQAVVSSGSEGAQLLLRVDTILKAAPRPRERM